MTASEAFRWLEELTYNFEFFGDTKHLRNIQRELGFMRVNFRRENMADNYLEALIEHANELIAACRYLRQAINEDSNDSKGK